MTPILLASGAPHLVDPHPAMIAPFALLLACIALMPFVAKHWWEHHYPKVAVGLGLVTSAYYLFFLRAGERIGHSMIEYGSFIALIGSLFVVCGGIHITVAGEAKPWVNTLFLGIGAVLANIVGTTGASMLMVRPWIRMNKFRFSSMHTVFFIFVVSNTGGCLTPIGDPPLFLGFLKGVPFAWTIVHLWRPWLLVTVLLLAVFFVFDTINFHKVPGAVRKKQTEHETWKFLGLHNVIFLGLILIGVFLPSPTGSTGRTSSSSRRSRRWRSCSSGSSRPWSRRSTTSRPIRRRSASGRWTRSFTGRVRFPQCSITRRPT
jgi:Na+/H+ antiporter NhaD/arsenite permease-like protein